MSSIAFIEVEGRFTMPPSRSAAPSSYGHEWVLLPAEAEPRAGIRSLYAAIVHTACLDVDAFLAACRWDSERDSLAVPATIAAAVRRIPAAQAPCEAKPREAARVAAEPFAREALPIGLFKAPRRRAARYPSRVFQRFVGRIGIVGAAMLLGWIVIGQVPPGPERDGMIDAWRDATNGSSSHRAVPAAPWQAGTDVEPQLADAVARPRRAPIATHAAAGARARDESMRNRAPVGSGLAHIDSRRLASSHGVVPPRESARPAASVERRSQARRVHRSASNRGVAARRALAAADDFDINDYADFADELRRRGAIPARNEQRPADTEWADQLSQRRLTDIPEQFSK
ncbi:hypothetical protein GIY62_04250 [Burkholderia plantarii]|uniref:hypothetical protein n=1 Tax=Burkholderia plantarii TaxID=41899 RepID=UPI00272CB690|nr:hypothetical protein [Burkholderia plantarii]WLE59886.1 hypothetical protein GIY62_04250 [Burkholderia plantarii]